ncbi:MAG: PIN domain-containing protein [Nitrococcus sp.]|nr:PIN domain-containing protein [Nitrococcus sp.]
MSGEFIDSNVFVYLFDETDDHKRGIAQRLVNNALSTRTGVISYQVVQETLNVMLCKLPSPVTVPDSQYFLQKVMRPLWRVMPSNGLYQTSIDIQGRYQYGFYDSLIIAAALDAGCTRLFTEDMQAGQSIDGLVIDNPFLPL